jgi:hypothetical protein
LVAAEWTQIGLWSAVVASGLYHGVNPAMGWPLAVSAGMMEKSPRAFLAALGYLAVGHLLAIFVVILPFALLVVLLSWQQEIRLGASILILGFGIFQLIRRRHPRLLARIRPTHLGLWAFTVAVAHGAGLMLIPAYLGLCRFSQMESQQEAAQILISANLDVALAVSVVHAMAMIAVGGFLGWLAYRYYGLTLIVRSWFNLDMIWAASFILLGALSLMTNLVYLRP